MIQKIGDIEYEFNVKLGVTIKIKRKFNKQFNEILRILDKFDIQDLIKLLYCGISEDVCSYNDFEQNILDNLGMMELYELVQLFVKKIQYPGLTEDEIDKKIAEKNAKYQVDTTLLNK